MRLVATILPARKQLFLHPLRSRAANNTHLAQTCSVSRPSASCLRRRRPSRLGYLFFFLVPRDLAGRQENRQWLLAAACSVVNVGNAGAPYPARQRTGADGKAATAVGVYPRRRLPLRKSLGRGARATLLMRSRKFWSLRGCRIIPRCVFPTLAAAPLRRRRQMGPRHRSNNIRRQTESAYIFIRSCWSSQAPVLFRRPRRLKLRHALPVGRGSAMKETSQRYRPPFHFRMFGRSCSYSRRSRERA